MPEYKQFYQGTNKIIEEKKNYGQPTQNRYLPHYQEEGGFPQRRLKRVISTQEQSPKGYLFRRGLLRRHIIAATGCS